jgi:hypothetical protein
MSPILPIKYAALFFSPLQTTGTPFVFKNTSLGSTLRVYLISPGTLAGPRITYLSDS